MLYFHKYSKNHLELYALCHQALGSGLSCWIQQLKLDLNLDSASYPPRLFNA